MEMFSNLAFSHKTLSFDRLARVKEYRHIKLKDYNALIIKNYCVKVKQCWNCAIS